PTHKNLELPTLHAIKQYVAMGNGDAVLPEISVETEIARGELVRIPVHELQLKRKLRLIYRKDANLSHAARAFLKIVEALALERKGRYRFQRESCSAPRRGILAGCREAAPHSPTRSR